MGPKVPQLPLIPYTVLLANQQMYCHYGATHILGTGDIDVYKAKSLLILVG